MTEHDVSTDTTSGGLSRRSLIAKGAVAGAVVWVTPMMLSATNVAAAASPCLPCAPFPYTENWAGVDPGAYGAYTTFTTGTDLNDPGPTPSGWIVTDTSVDSIRNPGTWANFLGFSAVMLDLAGTPGPGGVRKTFTFCESTYELKFEVGGTNAARTLQYGITNGGGGDIVALVNLAVAANSQQTVTVPFTVGPGGATGDVYFRDATATNTGVRLGKVDITQTCL